MIAYKITKTDTCYGHIKTELYFTDNYEAADVFDNFCKVAGLPCITEKEWLDFDEQIIERIAGQYCYTIKSIYIKDKKESED